MSSLLYISQLLLGLRLAAIIGFVAPGSADLATSKQCSKKRCAHSEEVKKNAFGPGSSNRSESSGFPNPSLNQ